VNTLALAWRNLLRNRRRSLTTLVAMVLGLVTVLLFGGYVKDLTYAMQTDFVQLSGHLQVQHRDYFNLGSGNPDGLRHRALRGRDRGVTEDPVLAPMVAVVTPTLQFGALAGNSAAGVSRTVFVTGIGGRGPEAHAAVERAPFSPRWPAHVSLSGTPPDTAVIGIGVARVLQLCAELDVPDCPPAQGDAAPVEAPTGGQGTPAADILPADIAALAGAAAAQGAEPPGAAGRASRSWRHRPRGAQCGGGQNVLRCRVPGHQGVRRCSRRPAPGAGAEAGLRRRTASGHGDCLQLQRTRRRWPRRARATRNPAGRTTASAAEPLAVLDYETSTPSTARRWRCSPPSSASSRC
jgi:putative ABC transport system permease protein